MNESFPSNNEINKGCPYIPKVPEWIFVTQRAINLNQEMCCSVTSAGVTKDAGAWQLGLVKNVDLSIGRERDTVQPGVMCKEPGPWISICIDNIVNHCLQGWLKPICCCGELHHCPHRASRSLRQCRSVSWGEGSESKPSSKPEALMLLLSCHIPQKMASCVTQMTNQPRSSRFTLSFNSSPFTSPISAELSHKSG